MYRIHSCLGKRLIRTRRKQVCPRTVWFQDCGSKTRCFLTTSLLNIFRSQKRGDCHSLVHKQCDHDSLASLAVFHTKAVCACTCKRHFHLTLDTNMSIAKNRRMFENTSQKEEIPIRARVLSVMPPHRHLWNVSPKSFFSSSRKLIQKLLGALYSTRLRSDKLPHVGRHHVFLKYEGTTQRN